MKKKFLTLLMALACTLGITGMVACKKDVAYDDSSQEKWGTVYTVQAAYAEAQFLGYEGTLDDFIRSISGKDGVDGKDGEDGKDGVDGEDGVGISSVTHNEDGTLTIHYTDGTSINVGKIDGKDGKDGVDGEDGKDGVGIENVEIDADGNLIVTFTDGQEKNLGKITADSPTGTPCVHKFSDWVAGEPATCESLGFNSRACVNCGVLDYDFIKPTGHTWDILSYMLSNPNEDEDGTAMISCSVCNVSKVDVIACDGDWDGDGLKNGEEIAVYNTDMALVDTDNDGLTDYEEVIAYTTNPLNADTDGDGASDGAEVTFGTDPLVYNDDFNVNVVIETEEDIVKPGIQVEGISGEQLNTLKIEENTYFEEAQTPGYMGQAYDYSIEGEVEATIMFEFEQPVARMRSASTALPTIYRYDAAKNAVFPQATTVVGNVASANVTTFGTYILLDRRVYDNQNAWIDNYGITNEGEYSSLEVVLVIDDSGSMSSNDRYYERLSVARTLVEKLPENSKVGIVKFGQYTTKLTSTLISDKKQAAAYLTTPTYFQNDESYTYMYAAINESFSMYQSTDDTTLKMMVVLSDGDAHDTSRHSNIISTAKANDVVIYTVGLGSSTYLTTYFNNYLKPLAEDTEGAFYLANQAEELAEIYKKIGQRIDILTDTDKDGISDYYEDNMPAFNGVQIKTDKNNADTDGDRLYDGEEIEVIYVYNGATLEESTKLLFYGKMFSDPTNPDTDGDGVSDLRDRFPMDANRN